MPTGVTISVAHNEARLAGTLANLNSGPGPGYIDLYTAPRPASGAAITTQAKLARITLADPAGTITPGSNTLTLTQAADSLFLLDGDAVWARGCASDNAHSFDCDVSAVGGLGQIKFANITVLAGGIARMVSAAFG